MASTVDISKDKDSNPVQPRLSSFPKTLIGGANRSFSSSWYDKFPLIEYSKSNDKVYCFCCRHFSASKVTSFITGYSDWKNMSKKFEEHFHSSKSTHMFCFEKYTSYVKSKRTGSVSNLIDNQRRTDVLRNREVLSTHIQVILLCAQQDIAFRGHRENEESQNRGNFIEILELLKQKCPELAKKSENMPGNAKYLDFRVQNEIINIAGRQVQEQIVQEIKSSQNFYSIIADETKDNAGVEQLSLCLRYVYAGEIKERFIGFVDLHQFNAESISNAIFEVLKTIKLDVKNMVSQSYDGASVMSGHLSGVNKRIEAVVEGFCPYIHCYAHRLNLVLVDCCKNVSSVREVLGLIQAIYNFQSNSVRRSEFFKEAQKRENFDKILEMPKSCDTRWSSKKNAISYFHKRYRSIIIALEDIIENGKPEENAECTGYLHKLQSFNTIITIVILDKILGYTNSLSEYLQCADLVYTRAIKLCKATILTLSNMRNTENFDEIWKESEIIAQECLIEVPNPNEPPLSNKRRRLISKNLGDSLVLSTIGDRSTEILTKRQELRSVFFEILEKFNCEMNSRLIENTDLFNYLSASEPKAEDFLNEEKVISFCRLYDRLDFNIESLKSQIPVARNLIISENLNTVKDCFDFLSIMAQSFPDLLKYYNLVLCFPVSSASAERSFSCLKRIKTFLRTTMSESRTSNLALLSINRDISNEMKKNPESILEEFGNVSTRRLTFSL